MRRSHPADHRRPHWSAAARASASRPSCTRSKSERVTGAASQRRCGEQLAKEHLGPRRVAVPLAIHQRDGEVQAGLGPIGRRGLDGCECVNRGVEVELPHQTDCPVVALDQFRRDGSAGAVRHDANDATATSRTSARDIDPNTLIGWPASHTLCDTSDPGTPVTLKTFCAFAAAILLANTAYIAAAASPTVFYMGNVLAACRARRGVVGRGARPAAQEMASFAASGPCNSRSWRSRWRRPLRLELVRRGNLARSAMGADRAHRRRRDGHGRPGASGLAPGHAGSGGARRFGVAYQLAAGPARGGARRRG